MGNPAGAVWKSFFAMHRVCKDIRDPNLWTGTPVDRMWEKYCRLIDRRVSAVFDPERPRPVVRTRESVLDQAQPQR